MRDVQSCISAPNNTEALDLLRRVMRRFLVGANKVRQVREELMMSKAELARKAGLSTLTIDRVEAGNTCRLDTKRKILHALGLKVSDKEYVFGEDGTLRPTTYDPSGSSDGQNSLG